MPILKTQSFLDHLCETYPQYAEHFKKNPPKVEPTRETPDHEAGPSMLSLASKAAAKEYAEKLGALDRYNEEVRKARSGG